MHVAQNWPNLEKLPPFLRFSLKLSEFFLLKDHLFLLFRMWRLKNEWPLSAPPRAYFYHPQLPKKKIWEFLMKIDGIHAISVPDVLPQLPPACFRVKVDSRLYILWSFFTDILCNHLYLDHYAHAQNQVYETSDALSLDSPNTDCWDSMFVYPQCFQPLKHKVCLAFS